MISVVYSTSKEDELEYFEDFDLVMDCTGPFVEMAPLGPGGHWGTNAKACLKALKTQGRVALGPKDILSWTPAQDHRHLLLAGEGEVLKMAFLKWGAWALEDDKRSLTIITHESNLTTYLNDNQSTRQLRLEFEKNWQKKKEHFSQEINKWKELESYMQAKIQKPLEPTAQLQIFEEVDVMAFDHLEDRQGIFLTLERPEFRPLGAWHKTCHGDALLIAKGKGPHGQKSMGRPMAGEKGFYTINHYQDIIESEKDILSFFSPAS